MKDYDLLLFIEAASFDICGGASAALMGVALRLGLA
jgi:hypothetical protein